MWRAAAAMLWRGTWRKALLVGEKETTHHRNLFVQSKENKLAVIPLGQLQRCTLARGSLAVEQLQGNVTLLGIPRDVEFQVAQNSRSDAGFPLGGEFDHGLRRIHFVFGGRHFQFAIG